MLETIWLGALGVSALVLGLAIGNALWKKSQPTKKKGEVIPIDRRMGA